MLRNVICMTCDNCKCEKNIPIKEGVYAFRNENRFLSNFYPCKILFENIEYNSTEHAYQAAKTEVASEKEKILKAKTAGEAKKISKRITVRADWDQIKLGIMENLLRQKFSKGTDLLEKLKNIKGEIIEGNYWHDNFYGVCACGKQCDGNGRNELGKLLMIIRDEFLEEDKK